MIEEATIVIESPIIPKIGPRVRNPNITITIPKLLLIIGNFPFSNDNNLDS